MGQLSRLWRADFPFRPARVPFFYGWVILFATTLGILTSLPGQTMGVSVFTEIFMERLGLSRVQLSLAYMLGTAGSGFLLPYAGTLLDRLGARRTIVYAAGMFGLVLVGMGHCDRIAAVVERWLGGDGTPWVGFGVIAVGFFAIRFLGQGVVTMTSRATLGKWFDRRRGLVFGISGVVISVLFSASPKLLDLLIGQVGWRNAYLLLGLSVLLGLGTVGWLLYRESPEECGLLMDGGVGKGVPEAVPVDRVMVREMTRAEALRTFSFWAFNLGTACFALQITAYTFHVVSIGAEAGLAKDLILGLFLPMAGVSLVVNFLSGWLGDRTRAKYLLLLVTGGLFVGALGMWGLGSGGGRVLLIAGQGVAGGAMQTVTGLVWPRFYGRTHLGAITGFNMATIVVASALGPFLFSLSKQFLGSYHPAFAAGAVVALVLTGTAFFADNPQRRLLPGWGAK